MVNGRCNYPLSFTFSKLRRDAVAKFRADPIYANRYLYSEGLSFLGYYVTKCELVFDREG